MMYDPEKLFDDIDRYRDERDNECKPADEPDTNADWDDWDPPGSDRDDDYSADLWKERFRRDNPGWTEEEYQSYFEKQETD